MGLDIYLMKLDDNGEEVILPYDMFPGKSYPKRLEYYDFEKYLESCGIDPAQYNGYTISDSGIFLDLVGGGSAQILDDSLVPTIVEESYAVLAREIGYERGNALPSYFKLYTNCWYKDSGLDADAAALYEVVKDQTVLDEMKKHFEPSSTVQSWQLEKDEFVRFSY